MFYLRGDETGSLEAYSLSGFTRGLADAVDRNGGLHNVFDRRLDEESVQSGLAGPGRSAYPSHDVQL